MALSLSDIQALLGDKMQLPEQELTEALSSINGSTMSVADMVQLQYLMSRYTMTGTLLSAIMKDMSDTMKGIVNKIG